MLWLYNRGKLKVLDGSSIHFDLSSLVWSLPWHTYLLTLLERKKHSVFTYSILTSYSNSDVVVKYLLEHSSDPNAVDESKNTPLHLAARDGFINIVRLLVESSKDVKSYVNSRNSNQDTALHLAAREGKCEVVKVLINFSSDRHWSNNDGKTAKQLALDAGCKEIQLLFAKFEDVEKEGAYVEISNDVTDLHSLAFKNDAESIVNLLQVK